MAPSRSLVRDFQLAFKCVEQIEQLGYTYKGENGELGQYYFTKGDPVGYHLYIVENSGETWAKRTAFRDYLKNNRESADRYAELKQQLASRYPDNLRAYQDGKLGFVERIVLAARHRLCIERSFQILAVHQGHQLQVFCLGWRRPVDSWRSFQQRSLPAVNLAFPLRRWPPAIPE